MGGSSFSESRSGEAAVAAPGRPPWPPRCNAGGLPLVSVQSRGERLSSALDKIAAYRTGNVAAAKRVLEDPDRLWGRTGGVGARRAGRSGEHGDGKGETGETGGREWQPAAVILISAATSQRTWFVRIFARWHHAGHELGPLDF